MLNELQPAIVRWDEVEKQINGDPATAAIVIVVVDAKLDGCRLLKCSCCKVHCTVFG